MKISCIHLMNIPCFWQYDLERKTKKKKKNFWSMVRQFSRPAAQNHIAFELAWKFQKFLRAMQPFSLLPPFVHPGQQLCRNVEDFCNRYTVRFFSSYLTLEKEERKKIMRETDKQNAWNQRNMIIFLNKTNYW